MLLPHIRELLDPQLLSEPEIPNEQRMRLESIMMLQVPEEIVDLLVSCNGTWHKRGFISLFGAVFIICYETGKVLDYKVMSKFCASCNPLE